MDDEGVWPNNEKCALCEECLGEDEFYYGNIGEEIIALRHRDLAICLLNITRKTGSLRNVGYVDKGVKPPTA
jgi:hypothetical protein